MTFLKKSVLYTYGSFTEYPSSVFDKPGCMLKNSWDYSYIRYSIKEAHLVSVQVHKYRKTWRTSTLLLLMLVVNYGWLEAQDDHYWAQQYGAVSTLMGGAMVGGVSDNSAVYYNPAALAFISNPSLSVDANVYKMDRIFIRDGVGKGINLNSAQMSVYPQIIAGMINILKNSRFKFSYSMLTRNHSNILVNTHYTDKTSQSDPDNPVPTSTSFVGVYDYVNQLNEQWIGMGIAYGISENLGIGATFFSSYRGQSYQLTNYVREIDYADSTYVFKTTTNDEAIKYSTFRLIAKFGLSYFTGPWKFGLTVTTPSIGLYGSGDIKRENSFVTVSEHPADMADNFLIMDQKSSVKANYKHPLSIAWGVDYQTARTRLAFSAEYFFKTGTYHLLKPEAAPFIYPPSYLDSVSIKTQINSYLHVENAARPVLNVGIGFSQVVYKRLSLLLGASTDFSSFDNPTEANELLHGFGGWDIYHVSAGMNYHKQKHTLSLGFSYSIAPSKNIPPYTVINQTPDYTGQARISPKTYSIILGYTYYFAKFSE